MGKYYGADDHDFSGTKLVDVGAATTDGDATRFEETPEIIQQDAADPGRTIFVQFTGDSSPGSPVRGDIRILES